MTIRALSVCVAAVTLPLSALAQTNPDPTEFAAIAASSDMLEIETSKLALEVSEDTEVRAFAEQMIRDHEAASLRLKEAAAEDGITVPASMIPKHTDELDALKAVNTGAFDQNYIKTQQLAHSEAVTLFEAFAGSEHDGELRGFAQDLLPKLEEHKAHADGMTPGDATPE